MSLVAHCPSIKYSLSQGWIALTGSCTTTLRYKLLSHPAPASCTACLRDGLLWQVHEPPHWDTNCYLIQPHHHVQPVSGMDCFDMFMHNHTEKLLSHPAPASCTACLRDGLLWQVHAPPHWDTNCYLIQPHHHVQPVSGMDCFDMFMHHHTEIQIAISSSPSIMYSLSQRWIALTCSCTTTLRNCYLTQSQYQVQPVSGMDGFDMFMHYHTQIQISISSSHNILTLGHSAVELIL